MIHLLIVFGTCLVLAACNSDITDTASYPSPDGKRLIAVVEELQGANDPAPWLTHVSLMEARDPLKRGVPGNLLELQGRGAVTAVWDGNSEVAVVLNDSFHAEELPAASIQMMGVRVVFRRESDHRTLDLE